MFAFRVFSFRLLVGERELESTRTLKIMINATCLVKVGVEKHQTTYPTAKTGVVCSAWYIIKKATDTHSSV